MKKVIAIVLMLSLLLFSLFAEENEKDDRFSLSVGSGIYVSQLGFAKDFGRMEVGININSGFPNLFVYSLFNLDDTEPVGNQIWSNLKDSITLAFAGDIYFKYDIINGKKTSLDLSIGIAGLYAGNFFENKLYMGFLEFGSRFTCFFNSGNGIYIESNIPVYAVSGSTNKEGETTLSNGFLFSEDVGALLLVTGLFCTRVGYKIVL